jgi:UDP-GlcNAc:undecaprenyl-phosphate GlcNAc-1-phosphate transferase
MVYLIVFFTGLVLTLFFTPSLIDFITRIKVVDLPGERRVNKSAIPRMGGLIVYMIVLLLIISFYGKLDSVRFFILASGLIAMLGIVDDMIKVKWNHKFIIQFLVAFFLVYFFS